MAATVRPLNPKLQEQAINELNEDPNRLRSDLEALEEWLSKQPHLIVRKERQWLVAFLRSCKLSLQRTKEKLDFYYTVRTVTPELLANRNPMSPEVQRVLDMKCIAFPLKSIEDTSIPSIFMSAWAFSDPNKATLLDICRTIFMSFDLLLYKSDNLSIAGQYVVVDMKVIPKGFIPQLTPSICKKMVVAYTKAYPIRVKGVYFINCSAVYETIVNMFKVFMSDKIAQRVKIFREENLHQVFEEIPAQVFPKEYGGSGGTWDEMTAEWKATLEEHREWIMEDNKYGSNESKRPGKPKTTGDIFGIEGSFRKLNVD